MKEILFVDDEKSVIEGLKRMLYPMRREWQMYFALSGEEALSVIEEKSIDVIVTDMRMPGMDGAELLTIIMEKYPHIIRIVLSGYSEQELILKSVRPTHQYLTKPCSMETLKNTINRASKLHKMLRDNSIKSIVSKMDSLPSQPALYKEILLKIKDPNSSMKDIGHIIEKDMAMTTQILKLINSSFFGFYKDITNPVQAATLLGINTIKTLVLSQEIFSMFKAGEELTSLVNNVWEYSSLTAHFCKLIARDVSDDSIFIEDAFMVGFLHDIGLLILSSKMPTEFTEIIKISQNEDRSLFRIEQEMLGTTHSQIGAYLLELWGFADDITEALFHYPDVNYMNNDKIRIGHILHLAAAFAHKIHQSDAGFLGIEINKDFIIAMNLSDRYSKWYKDCEDLYNTEAF